MAKKTRPESIRAFDIVGGIAVIETPTYAGGKETARKIMLQHKHIKSVYRKIRGHEGKLRVQKLRWVRGERKTTTTHKENRVSLNLDVAKVYFSPRQATERQRVFSQIKKPETVLVMFSGVGPFAIEIAKNTPAVSVYGIELNKTAHKYALENVKLNKVDAKTTFLCGDVRKTAPKLKKKFDRIVMPLPKGAEAFLYVAFKTARKGAIIHFYDFEKEEDIPQKAKEKVIKAAAAAKRKIKILNVVKCGQLAPRAYRVCVDFKIL